MRPTHLWLALIAVAALGASDSGRDRTEAGDAPKPAGRAQRCVVAGRIVDGSERGVADAKVAWIGDAPEGDDTTGQPVRTDGEGRFRLALDGPADGVVRGLIHATRGDDAASLEAILLRAGERTKDVGLLELGSARPLVVCVRRARAPTPGARVSLWAGAVRWHDGEFLGTAATDLAGRAEFPPLPALVVNVYAWGPHGSVGSATTDIAPGSAPTRVNVELGASRAVDVLVTTDDAPPRPIAGATVFRSFRVWLGSDVATSVVADAPNRIAPTAADGRTRVDGLPADRTVTIGARIAGRPRGAVECAPGVASVTIVVPKPTVIPVEEGERPRPPDGTELLVRGFRTMGADVEGRIEHGLISVPLTERELEPGLAIAPDGSLAPLDGAKPAAFFRPRSLVVRIVEKDGRGVVGAKVSLSSRYIEGPWESPIPTDDEGRARFAGLAPVKYFVDAFATARARHGREVGSVDLRPGDASLDVVVGAEGTVLAHVTVDGRPAIPERFRWALADGIVVDSTVDRAAGTVRIRARAEGGAPESGSIEFGGEGVRSSTVSFAWPARGGATSIEVPLVASPEVLLDLRADPDEDVHVEVERWEASSWSAKPWERGLWYPEAGPYQAGRARVELRAGRYRLRDAGTDIVSPPFDVPEHGDPVMATLDLTGLVTIRGRVECPDPADAKGVELALAGEGIDSRRADVPSGVSKGRGYDGTSFELRVPAGRRVTISPWHPRLQPAREGGEVTLVGPRDDVVLKMGAGTTLVAKLTDPDGRPLSVDELQHAWVTALPAAHPSWEPEIGVVTPIAGQAGTVSVSRLPFGTLEVWIQTEGFAARRLERTTLAADSTDLGEVRLSRGSTVRLRRVGKDGVAEAGGPFLQGLAVATFGPRQILWLGQVKGEFTGLGAGRWRIEVWPAGSDRGASHEDRALEIEVDGEHDRVLDVDASGWLVPMPK